MSSDPTAVDSSEALDLALEVVLRLEEMERLRLKAMEVLERRQLLAVEQLEREVERLKRIEDPEEVIRRYERSRKNRQRKGDDQSGFFDERPAVPSLHVVPDMSRTNSNVPDMSRTPSIVPDNVPDTPLIESPAGGTDAALDQIRSDQILRDQIRSDPRSPIVLIPCQDGGVFRVEKQRYQSQAKFRNYDIDLHFADLLVRLEHDSKLAPRTLAAARSWCDQTVEKGAIKAGAYTPPAEPKPPTTEKEPAEEPKFVPMPDDVKALGAELARRAGKTNKG